MTIPSTFRALVVSETTEGGFSSNVVQKSLADLPDHDVLIQVHYSSLNYKDALSASGNRGVTKQYPHTPGIDAAGIVAASRHPDFQPGDRIIVTGYDLGMNTPGGLAEYIRVPVSWIVPLPDGLSLKEAMILGTAGLTAAIALKQLQLNGLQPDQGPVFVTGATGGVGTMAIALLAHVGYEVTAITGKPQAHEWLRQLGATAILDRNSLSDPTVRTLLKGVYAGGIDPVGGTILGTLLKSLLPSASIAVCGLVASANLYCKVYPFILRGNNLLGIDSANYPTIARKPLWQRLGTSWKPDQLDQLADEIELAGVSEALRLMLQGVHLGRSIVNLQL